MAAPAPPAAFPHGWDSHRRRNHRPPARSRLHVLRAIKLLLLLGGLGSIATVVLWDKGRLPGHEDPPALSTPAPSHIMSGARLVGTDSEGRRYRVTADQVFEETGDTHAVHLDDLRAWFFSGTREVSLTAGEGRYDTATRQVIMSGGVRMDTQGGTALETESSAYFPAQGLVEGTDPVHVTGPWGNVRAGGFRLDTVSGTLKFTGRPVLQLSPGGNS